MGKMDIHTTQINNIIQKENLMVTCSNDCTIRTLQNGQLTSEFKHESAVLDVCFIENGIASVDFTGNLKTYILNEGSYSEVVSMKVIDGPLTSVTSMGSDIILGCF